MECGQESTAVLTGLIRMHTALLLIHRNHLVGGRGAMPQGSIRLHIHKEKQMYCRCGSTHEMKKRQEQQEGQVVGETVNYLHCEACGRNYLADKEKAKMRRGIKCGF